VTEEAEEEAEVEIEAEAEEEVEIEVEIEAEEEVVTEVEIEVTDHQEKVEIDHQEEMAVLQELLKLQTIEELTQIKVTFGKNEFKFMPNAGISR